MSSHDPEFIKCAMDAIEEGVKAQEIQEECACRLGYQSSVSTDEITNLKPQENA